MFSLWAYFTRTAAGSFITRILLSLGIGFLSYAGFSEVLALALSRIQSLLAGFPLAALNLLGLSGADYIVNSFFAAYSARVAMRATRKMMVK